MKLLRVVYVASASRTCGVCGRPKEAPCEMYEYIDRTGAKLVVDYECRMLCTEDRTVESFHKGSGPL